jgi:subfamily B ATP-binding cassette protein MsbA
MNKHTPAPDEAPNDAPAKAVNQDATEHATPAAVETAPEQPQSLRGTAQRLWLFFRPHRAGFVGSLAAFLLAAGTEVLVPALLAPLLNSQHFGGNFTLSFPLWMVPAILVALFAARGLFTFCGSYLLNRSTLATVQDIREALVARVIHAEASLFNRMSPGAAVSRVVNNPQEMINQVGGAFTTLLRDGTATLGLLGYLLYCNWKLTLLSLVTLPVLAWVLKKIHRRIERLGGQAYESQLRLSSVADDISRAWRVVRTFDAGQWEQARFAREAQFLRRTSLKNAAAGALMSPASQLVGSLGVALILTLALHQAANNGSTVGDFAAFIAALLTLISKARHLTDIAQPVVSGLVIARGCFELMDEPPEPDTGTRTLTQCRGDITFDAVHLTYPGAESAALKGLNLQVRPGQTVALVGSSGAGKTSVVSALLGFVVPQAGRITLDGVAIGELKKASLRRQFAVVSQDIALFDGTIAENVVYAAQADTARIESCLRAANLWDFVCSQPEGVNSRIGINGGRLSGGQRQRLAIARALYKDAPIWIFDEATSALDTESERAVQQAIEQWHGQKTLILIAHRLSTVRKADLIVVMAQGRVVEAGRHEELMAAGGLYAGMVRAQFD